MTSRYAGRSGACKRTALEAALPENQAATLADLDDKRSSQAPFQSRVRTWVDLCQAWAISPWPDAVRKVAASFRRGGYKSVQNYFDAAATYQERFREEAVDPLLRRSMRRFTRAVLRGLPGTRLKAMFPVDRLAKLITVHPGAQAEAWSPWTTAHAADALSSWRRGLCSAKLSSRRRGPRTSTQPAARSLFGCPCTR